MHIMSDARQPLKCLFCIESEIHFTGSLTYVACWELDLVLRDKHRPLAAIPFNSSKKTGI